MRCRGVATIRARMDASREDDLRLPEEAEAGRNNGRQDASGRHVKPDPPERTAERPRSSPQHSERIQPIPESWPERKTQESWPDGQYSGGSTEPDGHSRATARRRRESAQVQQGTSTRRHQKPRPQRTPPHEETACRVHGEDAHRAGRPIGTHRTPPAPNRTSSPQAPSRTSPGRPASETATERWTGRA